MVAQKKNTSRRKIIGIVHVPKIKNSLRNIKCVHSKAAKSAKGYYWQPDQPQRLNSFVVALQYNEVWRHINSRGKGRRHEAHTIQRDQYTSYSSPFHMRLKQVLLNNVKKSLNKRQLNHETRILRKGWQRKAWKNKIVIHNFDRFHTLCWAKIKTLCCPIAVEASGLDISDPIPHSWSISWRATSLGEWWSSWSSPPDPTPISFRRSTRWSGGFSPVTSKGWLQSFNRYCNDCITKTNLVRNQSH